MAVVAVVAALALVTAGCSKVIDESQIPVVTVPDTGSTPPTSDGAATTAAGGLDPNAPITLGSVSLDPCKDVTGAWCGSVDVPLDRSHPDGDQLSIGVELHPRTDVSTKSEGTIVAIEGGPGFSSTGSRDSYLTLFAPIMDHRDLLLIDDRGTGRSSPLSCSALQQGDDSIAAASDCAKQMGNSADDYGAATVADDLADVLGALNAGHIDLYGDSYGTFVAQAFAARHGDLLTTLVLDSAFPVTGGDPFHASRVPAMLRAFDAVCARSTTCAAQGTPTSDRITALLTSLRQMPVRVTTTDPDGNSVNVSADPSSLLSLLLSAATDWTVYRELDAAAAAWLAGDRPPLVRLLTHDLTTTSTDSLASYSAGVALSATCSDYPTVFDESHSTTDRLSDIDRALGVQQSTHPETFAPWTATEWQASTANELDQCATWPASDRNDPPAGTSPDFPDVPVLVLSGDLDTLTPPSEGDAAAKLFPNATFVQVANTGHVTALDDSWGCASTIVDDFITNAAVGDTSCAETIPEIRTVDKFSIHSTDATAATAAPGDASTALDRQIATVAVAEVGDAIAQWGVMTGDNGSGLRGGKFTVDDSTSTFTFQGAKFADDVSIDGTATLDQTSGKVDAQIKVTSPEGTSDVAASWDASIADAQAMARGTVEGRPLSVTLPAP